MNELISLPDITEEDLENIIREIYPTNRQYVSKDCTFWCRSRWNKIMCWDACKNSNNFTEDEFNSIKSWIFKKLNITKELFTNLKLEKSILKYYIVETVNNILNKKELEN